VTTEAAIAEAVPATAAPVADTRLRPGDPGYRRVNVAMFVSGVAIFAVLYSAQAVLPQLSADFGLTPASAALSMSVATAALALGVLPISALSERWGRVPVMTVSVVAVAVLGLLVPFSPTYPVLLVLRALQGLAVAGLPAVAVAYLADEVHPRALGGAVGLFIAGNGLGGLTGRMLAGFATDLGGWHAGLAAVALLALACAIAFVVLLPGQRHARQTPISAARLAGSVRDHLGTPALRRLFLAGFMLMGGFVTLYNFIGYRLMREPFGLSAAAVGLVFLAYLGGTVSSAVAGRLADRFGRPRVFVAAVLLAVAAAALTLPDALAPVLTGVVLLTVGFFGAHSVASGWIGRLARTDRAQASGLYLFAYYTGSSVGGWAGGLVYQHAGWSGTVVYLVALFTVALAPVLRSGRTAATS
jgi:YNFM family putative membrane transporter